jgi:putative lipoic acid-binding regulatory protein
MSNDETLLEFPCEFPVKIMARAHDTLENDVLEIVKCHAPDCDSHTLKRRKSANGNYIGLTITITATSKEQLDNLYRSLHAYEHCVMLL